MLTLYYNPLSPNARRVWLTLLEKKLPFEPVIMNLNGDQLQLDFLDVNPFHHIPVLIDDSFKLVESLAIMDYLEAKYPQPSLLPKDTTGLATVRMAQLLTANELFPLVVRLIVAGDGEAASESVHQKLQTTLQFFEELLGDRPYFGSQSLTQGDIVAAIGVLILPKLKVSLTPYPYLSAWGQRISARETWQQTEPSPEAFEGFKRRVRVLVRMRQRELK